MLDPPLHVLDGVAGVALIPAPVEVLGDRAELDDQVVGEVLRLDLAALLAPQPDQGGLVVAHDDPGIRAADERAAVNFPRHVASIVQLPGPSPESVWLAARSNGTKRASPHRFPALTLCWTGDHI